MVPGDIIEWVDKITGTSVPIDQQIWSTKMNKCLPIGSDLVHTLVSIDSERICWLHAKGCFHTHVDDAHRRNHFSKEIVKMVPGDLIE